jgi:hypothetical protein
MAALTLAPASAHAASVHPGQCAWPIKADPDLVNVAWPDEGAQYWATPFTVAPGTTMTIRGRFPRGRYMSFHLYEDSTPVDALTDVALRPDTGVNPFVAGADRSRAGTYRVHVVAGPRPTHPAANTLYAESLNGEPNVAGVILYRIYLPERDAQGGVPLPDVAYGDGAGVAPPLPPCQDAVPPTGSPLNDAIRGGSLPYDAQASSSDAPAWGISRSRPSATTAGPVSVRTGNPFFANQNALDAASAPTTMGAYYPETKVCSTAQFDKDRCGLPVGVHAGR